jgi:hypothetical protein
MSDQTTEPTRESRIRVNLDDYHQAFSDLRYHAQKAENARAKMNRAIGNLRWLDATGELERLNVR